MKNNVELKILPKNYKKSKIYNLNYKSAIKDLNAFNPAFSVAPK